VDHLFADWLEYLYDLCLVWAPEVQGGAVVEGDCGELGIAFFEYCLQVPANRIGSKSFSRISSR